MFVLFPLPTTSRYLRGERADGLLENSPRNHTFPKSNIAASLWPERLGVPVREIPGLTLPQRQMSGTRGRCRYPILTLQPHWLFFATG